MTQTLKKGVMPLIIGMGLGALAFVIPVKWILLMALAVVFVFAYPLVLKALPYIPAFYIFIDYTLRKFSFFSGIASIWDELLFVGMIGVLIIEAIRSKGAIKLRLTALDIPVALFVLMGITHVLIIKPELSIAIEGFRAMFQYVLWFFVMTQFIRTREQAQKILYVFVLTGLFLGLHATYQYVAGVEMPGNWVDSTEVVRTRAFSIIGSPNILGSLFVLFTPMGVAMTLIQKKWANRIFFGGATLFMMAGLVFTLSRGAWLALAGGLFFASILFNRKLVFHLSALGGIVLVAGGSFTSRLLSIFSPTYLFKSAAGGRIYRWTEGLAVWSESKLFGVGLGRFGGAVATNNKLSPFYLDNYYIKTLVEMGIFGLTALIAMMLTLWGYAAVVVYRQREVLSKIVTIGFCAGIVGVILHNMVENIFEVPAMVVYFWTSAAALTVYATPASDAETNTSS